MSRVIIIAACVLAIIACALFFMRGDGVSERPKNDTILAFGDSLVAGTGSTQGGGFVSYLGERIDRKIINLGVPGDTTADALARLPAARRMDPGTVIVLLGGNDALRRVSVDETFANLETIVQGFRDDGAVVILLGVRGGILGDPYNDRFNALSEKTGAHYIDDVLSGLITKPEYMADSVHPNDMGYRIIADRVYDVVLPLLES